MELTMDLQKAVEEVLAPLDQWSKRCHEASVTLVESRIIQGMRIARGSCIAVPGQHSWVTVGDPYSSQSLVVDPTLWSYRGTTAKVFIGMREVWKHTPHGSGNIFKWGRPPQATGPVIELEPPAEGWSWDARVFLEILGPLDHAGWSLLAHAPVQGWPSREILTQLLKHPTLGPRIPIDIVGMVIGSECNGLYPQS
jgi:hypothetical protein